jgi:hypothetical protein
MPGDAVAPPSLSPGCRPELGPWLAGHPHATLREIAAFLATGHLLAARPEASPLEIAAFLASRGLLVPPGAR